MGLFCSDESIGTGSIEITQSIAGEELASHLSVAVRIVASIAETHEILDEHARVRTDSHRCFTVSDTGRVLIPCTFCPLAGL